MINVVHVLISIFVFIYSAHTHTRMHAKNISHTTIVNVLLQYEEGLPEGVCAGHVMTGKQSCYLMDMQGLKCVTRIKH